MTFTYENGGPSNDCFYYSEDDHYTWAEADAYCRGCEAHLVSIPTSMVNYLLSHPRSGIKDGSKHVYWIGLNSLFGKRGVYKWSDGSPADYFNYANTTSVLDPLPNNVKDQGILKFFLLMDKLIILDLY